MKTIAIFLGILFQKSITNFIIILSSIWVILQISAFFADKWVKDLFGNSWWIWTILIPIVLAICWSVISNQNSTSTPPRNSQDKERLDPKKSGIEITCKKAVSKNLNSFYQSYLDGAIKRIYCNINGINKKELSWTKSTFIPLQVDVPYHITIEYEIADHIVSLKQNPIGSLFFTPFSLLANNEATKKNYTIGGDAELDITINSENPIKYYNYQMNPESIWASGKLTNKNR
jgi:hypothetical protein